MNSSDRYGRMKKKRKKNSCCIGTKNSSDYNGRNKTDKANRIIYNAIRIGPFEERIS